MRVLWLNRQVTTTLQVGWGVALLQHGTSVKSSRENVIQLYEKKLQRHRVRCVRVLVARKCKGNVQTAFLCPSEKPEYGGRQWLGTKQRRHPRCTVNRNVVRQNRARREIHGFKHTRALQKEGGRGEV